MDLKLLSDAELHASAIKTAGEERIATAFLIEHIREVERRKYYAELKCSSLFKYCIKHLKLSEASAQRRIDAMWMSEAVPVVAEKIENGDLNLSLASRLQVFIRHEEKEGPVSEAKKAELVAAVEGKSCREAERELFKHTSTPEKHYVDRVKPVSLNQIQITFTVNAEQLAMIEKAKALLVHTIPQATWGELFTTLAEKVIQQKDPRKNTRATQASTQNVRRPVSPAQKINFPSPTQAETKAESNRTPSRPLRRAVWERDQGKCVNCGTEWALEVDHVTPWAKNGETKLENLRLLCRNCNQREAIRHFGT